MKILKNMLWETFCLWLRICLLNPVLYKMKEIFFFPKLRMKQPNTS